MSNVVISGSGLFHPEESISNDELVASFNTYVANYNIRHAAEITAGKIDALKESSSEFIEKASGIKSRYIRNKFDILDHEKMWPFIPEREDNALSMQAEAGLIAAKEALKNANKSTADIDAVIVSCTHKQRDYPSIAIEIQNALGITGYAYDMGVACSSATFAIQAAYNAIKAETASAILVVVPEIIAGQVNYRDRDSHFIFGEADVAIILEREETCVAEDVFQVIDINLLTQFSNNIRNNRGAFNRCAPEGMDLADKMFYQNGRKVFKEVLPLASSFINEQLQKNHIDPKKVARYWLHQANSNMNRVIAEHLMGKGYALERAPIVLDEFANTGAAGSIVAFYKYHQGIASGEYAVLCSFGAGYSIGCIILQKLN